MVHPSHNLFEARTLKERVALNSPAWILLVLGVCNLGRHSSLHRLGNLSPVTGSCGLNPKQVFACFPVSFQRFAVTLQRLISAACQLISLARNKAPSESVTYLCLLLKVFFLLLLAELSQVSASACFRIVKRSRVAIDCRELGIVMTAVRDQAF